MSATHYICTRWIALVGVTALALALLLNDGRTDETANCDLTGEIIFLDANNLSYEKVTSMVEAEGLLPSLIALASTELNKEEIAIVSRDQELLFLGLAGSGDGIEPGTNLAVYMTLQSSDGTRVILNEDEWTTGGSMPYISMQEIVMREVGDFVISVIANDCILVDRLIEVTK